MIYSDFTCIYVIPHRYIHRFVSHKYINLISQAISQRKLLHTLVVRNNMRIFFIQFRPPLHEIIAYSTFVAARDKLAME